MLRPRRARANIVLDGFRRGRCWQFYALGCPVQGGPVRFSGLGSSPSIRLMHLGSATCSRVDGKASKAHGKKTTARLVGPASPLASDCSIMPAVDTSALRPDVNGAPGPLSLPYDRRVCNADSGPAAPGRHGCRSPLPVAEGVAGKPSCRTSGRSPYVVVQRFCPLK